MIRVLKQGISADAAEEIDTEVRTTVEEIIADIKARGDAAVRDLSERFDSYSPASFRLTDAEVEACVDRVPEQTIEDIKFAQAQVRNFAEIQRTALKDVEVETFPGVVLGHKNIPVNSVHAIYLGVIRFFDNKHWCDDRIWLSANRIPIVEFWTKFQSR